jgi:hypothetical protein
MCQALCDTDLAHRKLDAAVLDAYGWLHELGDQEVLVRLLALNQPRAGHPVRQTDRRLRPI